ncbi:MULTISPECIES: DUF406 family protein [Salinivibrio]|uniref:DUF406 domain-containing protein n=1 Tax=Salinivibrio siamensis TaxID=414286 RepID=A0ABX3KA63_9GAMM|nr:MULTISPECIES: DUF406 family protein [Salinivibrio]KKA43613.1 hypothetical protein WN56_14740 [Salinivibrio sp. KP-1]MPS30993.1 DUF406 family protein [Salinivibrio sp. VYel7]MPX92394.1 DUF406 family protein [Salinivibrio sp. VYel9]MPX97030.1 DUF406 family protein [Salinivibrio sp. VYel6]MPX98626.1 DUF406 family protein [Salinivibrio sp. VYel4]
MKENQTDTCDACGVSAEIGYIISEGDEVAEVTIHGDSNDAVQARFEQYLALAESINPAVKHDFDPQQLDGHRAHIKLQFECSAEKLIFELRSRGLNNA